MLDVSVELILLRVPIKAIPGWKAVWSNADTLQINIVFSGLIKALVGLVDKILGWFGGEEPRGDIAVEELQKAVEFGLALLVGVVIGSRFMFWSVFG